ncbi:hypothetical protein [Paenibacillus donghaensis]|uniref:Uncharacterized protein n=1 Tax=Paenibacillus donghaensis TaxID=414771 RepID=A0A2Z2K958_9BACL|nr:hypothetical protein [Paenibacillus donghaensis]ASA19905.1 hypothetical protein B9T62_03250 [Paenibacillus donghaensis]
MRMGMGMRVMNAVVVIVVIIAVLFPVYLYNEGKNAFSNKRQYEMNWQLKLPSNFNELDQYNNQGGFHGDGISYTIFRTKGEYTSSILESTGGRKTIVAYSGDSLNENDRDIKLFTENITAQLGVAQENTPAFNEVYQWQEFNCENDRLVVLYFPDKNLVYFAEDLK